jgi:L-aspartate oxidase
MEGRASLDRLWVCGEAASTGLHGANRLASNGLLEAVVYARLAAQDIAREIAETPAPAQILPVDLAFPDDGSDRYSPASMQALREIMTDKVGVLRDADGLKAALAGIAALEAKEAGSITFANMCATATLIAAAALVRQESRGGHYRTDFPKADPGQAERSRMTLAEALEIRASAAKELA